MFGHVHTGIAYTKPSTGFAVSSTTYTISGNIIDSGIGVNASDQGNNPAIYYELKQLNSDTTISSGFLSSSDYNGASWSKNISME